MPSKTNILKPGILVSLKTSTRGGVSYQRRDLEAVEASKLEQQATQRPAQVARWETTRVIEDAVEHEAAGKVRAKASGSIRGVCALTSFGLLCAEADEEELDAGITEARKIADEFNAGASTIQLDVYVLKGRIASTDEEAARAIASDVTDLLAQMELGIGQVGEAKNPKEVTRAVEVVREAASRAKRMGTILDDAQSKKVGEAVEAARKAAREIVKRVQKEGEDASTVVAALDLAPISGARFSFLDLEAPASQPVGEALPETAARSLDLPRAEDAATATARRQELEAEGLSAGNRQLDLLTAQVVDLGDALKRSVKEAKGSAYVGRRISEAE